MCSLGDFLETCPSLESMVRTNYGYGLSSHSISNAKSIPPQDQGSGGGAYA